MSLLEFERLTEIEKKYNSGLCEIYHRTTLGAGSYYSSNIVSYNADEGMKLLTTKLREAENKLHKRKWYQFVELK